MRRIVTLLLSTVTVLVLLFSYHTSTNQAATAGATDDGGTPQGTTSSGTTPNSSAGTGSGTTTGSSGSGTGGDGTYTGDVVRTRWGAVQVQVTVKNGTITAAEAVEYPSQNPRDQQINAYAIPKLNAEVVAAQSATIDAVSGATVTSDGYIESLQSALDAAHR